MKREAIASFGLVLLLFWSMFPMVTPSKAVARGNSGFSAAQSSSDSGDSWPMFRHDLTHSGYSTSTAPNTNQTLWAYKTGGAVETSPAVADGMVFIGSSDNMVYALNASTEALVWNYTTGGTVYSSPAVADGMVFVGSEHPVDVSSTLIVNFGEVYALNATNGALIWNYTTPTATDSSPSFAEGIVYVAESSNVYALNASTGALVWEYYAGLFVESSPAVENGVAYVGSEDKSVYALNASTGAYVWRYTTGEPVDSSPTVADGRVFVGSLDNNTYALNATNGALIWDCKTDSVPSSYYLVGASSPAVVGDIVYVGSTFNHKVFALNATNGAYIWSYTTGGIIYSSPAVADHTVFIGSDDDNLYALDASTGAFVWSYATGGTVFSSPAVADGIVYVGSDDGNIYAFGPRVPVHDVAVASVAYSKTVVGRGNSLNISVTAANLGDYAETLNVTLYANATSVASQTVTLSSANAVHINFTWNTTAFAYGSYTINAYAGPVQNETNNANDNLTEGTVYVGIPGDINGDGKVDILDAVTLENAFLTTTSNSEWNPNADINGDGIVNILDATILGTHFLKHYP